MKIDHEHKGLIVKWTNQIRNVAPDLHFEDVVMEVITEITLCADRVDPAKGGFTTLAEVHLSRRRFQIIGRLRGTSPPFNAGGVSLEGRQTFVPLSTGLADPNPGPLEQLIAEEEEALRSSVLDATLAEHFTDGEELREAVRAATRPTHGSGISRYAGQSGDRGFRTRYQRERNALNRLLDEIDNACREVAAFMQGEKGQAWLTR